MGQIDFGPSDLAKAIRDCVDHPDPDQRAPHALDAVYCLTHNLWGSLETNTAETDVAWFARALFEADDSPDGRRWDNVPEATRERYGHAARLAIENLPRLMSRMANRCRWMAEAAKMAIEADRAVRERGEASS